MGVPYVRVGWLAMITSTQHPKYKLLCKILRHTWNLSTISDQNQGPGDLIDIGGRGAKICYPNCFLHRLFSFFTPLLFGEKNPMWLEDLSDRVADSHRTWVPIHKKNVLPTIKKNKKVDSKQNSPRRGHWNAVGCRTFVPTRDYPTWPLSLWLNEKNLSHEEKKRSDTFHWNPGWLRGMFILIPT